MEKTYQETTTKMDKQGNIPMTEKLSCLEEYDIELDHNGRQIKVCKRDCSCHQGARYDQIECRCEYYCGDFVE